MNQQLLAKIRARRKEIGEQIQPQIKKNTRSKTQKITSNNNNKQSFTNARKLLQQNLFKQNNTEQNNQPIKPKQQIKGNHQNMMNARKMLQAKLGGGSTSNNVMGGNINIGLNLPPPPPPPPSNLMNLPPPPPPPMGLLPPPPPMSNILPPPPPMSNILPPPPPMSNILPPPPPMSNILPPPPMSNILPPPPMSNILPPPPMSNINDNANISKQLINNIPPPPPPLNKNIAQIKQPQEQHYKTSNIPQQFSSQQQQYTYIKQQKPIQSHNKKKNKIFMKQTSFTTQFFNKDIAGYLKRQFIKDSNILSYIGQSTKKQTKTFDFPSIQKQTRPQGNIQPKQTFYVDTKVLSLVGSFMVNNLNCIKNHNQARQNFMEKVKNYDIDKDILKLGLKPIKQLVEKVPYIQYYQPNLVKINHSIAKCVTLINLKKDLNLFQQCLEIQKLKEQFLKIVEKYCKYPQNCNDDEYEQIDTYMKRINQIEMKSF